MNVQRKVEIFSLDGRCVSTFSDAAPFNVATVGICDKAPILRRLQRGETILHQTIFAGLRIRFTLTSLASPVAECPTALTTDP